MASTGRGISRAVLGGTLIALTLAAAAVASAPPRAGDWTDSRGTAIWHVSHSKMTRSRDAKGILTPSNYKCNTWSLRPVASKIAISGGKFKYVGKAYLDFVHRPKLLGKLTWTGTYSRSRVRGTVRLVAAYTAKDGSLVKKHCDTGTRRWRGFVSAR